MTALPNCLGYLTDPRLVYSTYPLSVITQEVCKLQKHYKLLKELSEDGRQKSELESVHKLLANLLENLEFDFTTQATNPGPGTVDAYNQFLDFVLSAYTLVATLANGNEVTQTNRLDAKFFGLKSFDRCLKQLVKSNLCEVRLYDDSL